MFLLFFELIFFFINKITKIKKLKKKTGGARQTGGNLQSLRDGGTTALLFSEVFELFALCSPTVASTFDLPTSML